MDSGKINEIQPQINTEKTNWDLDLKYTPLFHKL